MSDLQDILNVNAKSFLNDQYLNYMFHEIEKEERAPFIRAIQKAFIKQTIGANQSYCIGDKATDGVRSLALMLPPQVSWPEDLWEVYTQKQEKILLGRSLTDTYDRFIELEEFFSERFEHFNAIDGYYLLILSTDETYRGQGLANKIMNILVEKLDREQKSCYLECTNSKLLTFYERYGFQALQTTNLPIIPANISLDLVPKVTFFKRMPKPLTSNQ
ncbi:hypothetical protein SAMD00019534_098620 [Acytostelium subglobosum LB1]|uniref:hypothetical protein n=1 Tax=Acytostelium subglobosum LB1 TaxID=1410327 RepID=UPI000644ABF8|nr:hypothetical protein SAMD00019534_098620 [Acytostelium subglobosum LB1]GAM26687.1 hypothetical protein SAMD00019534_098620 [Acytostelium subglobosum LB1]|eukprot:XP_012750348.1 hypothetical protein SAMD00019534_098620 [Acytostelium subglobosum LB1]